MKNFRIIGKICLLNNIAVQSYTYNRYLPLGKPEIVLEYLNKWGIDEIMILDIKNSIFQTNYLKKNLKNILKNCNTPVTIGGGINTIQDVEYILRNGADKVVINTSFLNNMNLLKQIVNEFGSQAIISSIDYKYYNNDFTIYSYSGTKKNKINIKEYIKRLSDNGVGEIILNSINHNGKKNGLDFKFLNKYNDDFSCPVISSCGINNHKHILSAIDKNISAVAIGNLLNHFEHTVMIIKKILQQTQKKKYIRLDTKIKYKDFNFDIRNRILPKNDKYLQNLNKAY